MERLYCDASYHCGGYGGMAVVGPGWSGAGGGKWRELWNISVVRETAQSGRDYAVFYAACPCSGVNEAEMRALGMAFLLAHDIIRAGGDRKIEIASDSLVALNWIMNADVADRSLVGTLRAMWGKERIILSKVKAHAGNEGNELADRWAKYARREGSAFFRRTNGKGDKRIMKIPYFEGKKGNEEKKNLGNGKGQPRNPFDDASEMDIATLTERVLNDDGNIGYVTSDGRVMPRNDAFAAGEKDGIELVKERIWGCATETDIRDIDVIFSEEATRAIAHEVREARRVETGGALIGRWERQKDGVLRIRVERATAPGNGAVKQHSLFSPDLAYYRSRVGYYRTARNWDYIGEWHKHPDKFDHLSGTDLEMARSLFEEEGWPFLLLPVVTLEGNRLHIDTHLVLASGVGPRILGIGRTSIDIPKKGDDAPIVFIDKSMIEKFRDSGVQVAIFDKGVCHIGESYVFMPCPGNPNASLKMVRAGDAPLYFSDKPGEVSALVGDDTLQCYHVHEGEIFPLPFQLVDSNRSIYERNEGLNETTVLRAKSVAILGCGSLGSTIALELARAGVGRFYLIDYDRLMPANIGRHTADLSYLGRNKAQSVREMIRRINPVLDVQACPVDAVSIEGMKLLKEEILPQIDLLICATDTDDTRIFVNDLAVAARCKALQAGLHERASSGLVHVYDPDTGHACFACRRENLLSESGKRNEGIAYSAARNLRDLTVQPGLSAQINLVAEVATLRAIGVLMDTDSLPDLSIVYVDRGHEDSDTASRCLRLRIAHLDLEKVPACPACGNEATAWDGIGSDAFPENERIEEGDEMEL